MIIIGLDPHPATNTAAALDAPSARLIDTIRVENTEEGLEELRAWAGRFSQRRWAIEGATNPFIATWAGVLVGEGEDLFSISPALTSQYRKRRGAKKNDETDAMNAARALLANPELPAHFPDPHQRRLQEITRNRRRVAGDLKANRMALGALASSGGGAQERKILEDIVGGHRGLLHPAVGAPGCAHRVPAQAEHARIACGAGGWGGVWGCDRGRGWRRHSL